VREFAQRVLESLGYHVLVASNGEEAVQAFEASRKDIKLLILDVVMPKISGPKSYETISGIQADVPVMYISGYSESMTGMAIHDKKVQLLRKPFSVEELGNRVRKVLDGIK
jgi:DNA-binding response OmpR family regulator